MVLNACADLGKLSMQQPVSIVSKSRFISFSARRPVYAVLGGDCKKHSKNNQSYCSNREEKITNNQPGLGQSRATHRGIFFYSGPCHVTADNSRNEPEPNEQAR